MFRPRPVSVVNQEGHISHFGTPPQYVPDLVMELLDWVKTAMCNADPQPCIPL